MAEQITEQVTKQEPQKAEEVLGNTQEVKTPEPDLVTKVSQFKASDKPNEPQIADDSFDLKEIEAITDPVAKEQAMKAYKSFQRGFTQKYQDLADLRKTLESKVEDKAWTPERVQSLMNDPNFVNAAQSIVGNPQSEEYSALTDEDKKLIQEAKEEAKRANLNNAQLIKQQQDESLKSKYANYAPDIIDSAILNVQKGKAQITREDLWKSIDYNAAVQRAYSLGKQDKQLDVQEKVNSVSAQGISTVAPSDAPAKEDKESDRAYLKRLYMHNLLKSGKNKKT